jgi:hypothetical protein
MARKVELGAGVAAGVLSIAALAMLLLAPLVPYCPQTAETPCAQVRYTALAQTGLDVEGWAYLLGMTALLLMGAAGAVIEARTGAPRAAVPLWIGAALALAGCAFGARAAGLVYLPAVLALCLATYASLLRRMRAWDPERAEAEAVSMPGPIDVATDPGTSSNRSG